MSPIIEQRKNESRLAVYLKKRTAYCYIANVDALICGGIGGGAQRALQEAGIKLYAGASGNTDAVVDALIAGTLDASGEANCDHHDHEHSEGHSCGHGGCHH